MRNTPIRPLRKHSKVILPPHWEHRQRTYCIYFQPRFDMVRKVYIHNNCRCNEYVALRNRVLFQTITPNPVAINKTKVLARLIADWLPKGRHPNLDWIQDYTGRKRRKYESSGGR